MEKQRKYEYKINGKTFHLTATQMNRVFEIETTIALAEKQCKECQKAMQNA